jgi:hypothetical protein
VALSGCGATLAASSDTDAGTSTASCTAVARTCDEVKATFAAATNTGVTLTCDAAAGTFQVSSTGEPNYTSNQKTPNAIKDQGWVVTLPLTPQCADATTSVVASRGAIGFMINGVPFYGPQDANGADAVVNEGPSFDDCQGHADMSCSYHYHEEPVCVFGKGDTAANHRLADAHPPVIGYAMDGFALYASSASATLDACNGHTDAARGYHYHATAKSPYLIGCDHGKVTGAFQKTMAVCGR